MDPYDQRAWDALERERERQLTQGSKRLVPAPLRARAQEMTDAARKRTGALPGAGAAEALVQQVFAAAAEVAARTAAASLIDARITKAYQSAGHSVRQISDIQQLQLRDVDLVKPRFEIAYVGAGVASGAAAGFAISGGELLGLIGAAGGAASGAVASGGVGAVPGAGVGAAPGAGLVAGAMAADTGAVLLATARVVFHTAAYYGYDTNRPEERLRALGVLNYATAGDQAAKNQAYLEIEKLAGLIVRNATWNQLDQSVITRIVRRVFEQLGMRLTKQRLGASLLGIGIVVGAVLNGRTLSRTADAADLLYRQQFLCDKYNLPFPGSPQSPETSREDDISVSDIIDEEIDRPEDMTGLPEQTEDEAASDDPGQTDDDPFSEA